MDLKGTCIIVAGVLLGLLIGAGSLVVARRGHRAAPDAPAPPAADPVQYQVVTVRDGETVVVVVVAVPAPPAGGPDSAEQGAKRKNLPRPGVAPAGGEGAATPLTPPALRQRGAAPISGPPPKLSPW